MNFLFKVCAVYVAIFTLWTSAVASQPTSVPSSFSAVFMQCVRESNQPTITGESDILTVLLTITQSQRVFASFLDCMGNRTMYTFRNSNDTTEWYMARVFDKARARQYWGLYGMYNQSANGFSCLTSSGYMDKVELCLNDVTTNIDTIRQKESLQLDTLSNSEFQQAICRKLNSSDYSTPTDCIKPLVDANCASSVEQFVSTFIMMITCNSYGPSTTTTSTTTTTTASMASPYTLDVLSPSPIPGRPQGAIFSCLFIIYPGSRFEMLFPPSEANLYMIQNVTIAHRQHEIDIDRFCSKINQYTQCVTVKISNPKERMDYILKQYIDVENFGRTFTEYCANKKLINFQFQCTYRSLLTNQTCRGGMNDVITKLVNSHGQNVFLCRQFKTARECRVNNQLMPCGLRYATAMEKLLAGVLNEQCRSGALIFPENEKTDLQPCFGEYMLGSKDRVTAAFGNRKPDPDSIVNYIMKETEWLCSHKNTMFTCITMKLKDSTKDLDMLIKAMFSIENMDKILDYSCDMVTDLKTHVSCLVNNYKSRANSSQDFNNCTASWGQNVRQGMGNKTNDKNYQRSLYCNGMVSVMRCYTPILSGCGGNLRNRFDQLTEAIENSCNNLSYKLEFKNSNSGSNTRALAPMALVLSLLLLKLV